MFFFDFSWKKKFVDCFFLQVFGFVWERKEQGRVCLTGINRMEEFDGKRKLASADSTVLNCVESIDSELLY